jgi:hypothetical protein
MMLTSAAKNAALPRVSRERFGRRMTKATQDAIQHRICARAYGRQLSHPSRTRSGRLTSALCDLRDLRLSVTHVGSGMLVCAPVGR